MLSPPIRRVKHGLGAIIDSSLSFTSCLSKSYELDLPTHPNFIHFSPSSLLLPWSQLPLSIGCVSVLPFLLCPRCPQVTLCPAGTRVLFWNDSHIITVQTSIHLSPRLGKGKPFAVFYKVLCCPPFHPHLVPLRPRHHNLPGLLSASHLYRALSLAPAASRPSGVFG